MQAPAASSSRQPLAPLPLSRFAPPGAPAIASPLSMPSKRAAPATPGTPERQRDARKKAVRTVTPREKLMLERDELGVGKSPARRLFAPDSPSIIPSHSGVSGVTLMPIPNRSLAPSPPIAESSSMASSSMASPSLGPRFLPAQTMEGENGVEINAHHPGFVILNDEKAFSLGVSAPATPSASATARRCSPRSRKDGKTPTRSTATARSGVSSVPDSPTTSAVGTPSRLDNQENIPPRPSLRSTPVKPFSPRSSPIKTGQSTRLEVLYTYDEEADDVAGVMGVKAAIIVSSGGRETGRRGTGKSKLAQVIGGDLPSDEDGPDDELTPGRVLRTPMPIAREIMIREIMA